MIGLHPGADRFWTFVGIYQAFTFACAGVMLLCGALSRTFDQVCQVSRTCASCSLPGKHDCDAADALVYSLRRKLDQREQHSALVRPVDTRCAPCDDRTQVDLAPRHQPAGVRAPGRHC
jgi:hypothetical protein